MKVRTQIPFLIVAAFCIGNEVGSVCGQAFQELYDFVGGSGGMGPQGSLIQARDGNFYGATTQGGEWGCGTIFKMTPQGLLITLASFDCTNGWFPYGGLLEGTDGNFYGTTRSGQTGYGTLFKMTPDGTITRLFRFDGGDGAYPNGDLAQGPDGKLYGTCTDGGDSGGSGIVFRMGTNAQPWQMEVLAVFYLGNGSYPSGGLLLAKDGNFYGVTAWGGGLGPKGRFSESQPTEI